MKKYKIFIILFLLLLPIFFTFAQVKNVGIIPANIWYSKDPFEEGDKIKIFTVIYNPDEKELSGTAIFFDNNVFLGKKNFSVSPKSTQDVSIDWEATVGEHIIFAKIENTKFLISKDKYEEIYVVENKTEESKREVSKKIDLEKSTNSILDMVKENTPEFVPKTVNSVTNIMENTREKIGDALNEKEKTVEEEIEKIKQEESKTKKEIKNDLQKQDITKNKFTKPFKYVELFFLKIFSFVFDNKIIFYPVLIILVFLLLRYLWRLIF